MARPQVARRCAPLIDNPRARPVAPSRRQVLLKWWYAQALLRLRHHIIFSDPDIAWLADPFDAWQRSFDLQGLSDIFSMNLTLQRHHEIDHGPG